MAGLSEAVKKMMQAKQQEVKDKMASGNFTKQWNLTGKNTIVQPGDEVVVRFGPRWDIVIEVNGKLIKNPEYISGAEPIFVIAYEHWWDADGGKTQHAWCPKTLNPDAECPVCIASAISLKEGTEDSKKYGKRIQAKEVFIFNAVVGIPRKIADGKADFRIMSVPATAFSQIVDIMTGGSEESFARGNVGDHLEGYDMKFSRPRKDAQGDRWKVDCAKLPSALFAEGQKAAFANWPGLLVNLEEMLTRETKTPLDLFKAFYGRDPEADEMSDQMSAAQEQAAEPQTASEPGETNPEPDLADEFAPPAAGQKPTAPVPPKAGAVKPTAPRTGGRR